MPVRRPPKPPDRADSRRMQREARGTFSRRHQNGHGRRYGRSESLPVVRRAPRSSCACRASSSGYRPPILTSSRPAAIHPNTACRARLELHAIGHVVLQRRPRQVQRAAVLEADRVDRRHRAAGGAVQHHRAAAPERVRGSSSNVAWPTPSNTTVGAGTVGQLAHAARRSRRSRAPRPHPRRAPASAFSPPDVVAITRPPRSFTTCVSSRPTPPAAAWTTRDVAGPRRDTSTWRGSARSVPAGTPRRRPRSETPRAPAPPRCAGTSTCSA